MGMTAAVQNAMVFSGPVREAQARAKECAEHILGHAADGNPDYREATLETFGIDESRDLKERAAQRPVGGDVQVFVVVAERLTLPAQNALLKILEEPLASTYLFFVVPHAERLLGTLRSRVRVEHVVPQSTGEDDGESTRFLAALPALRIQMVERFYLKAEKDRLGAEQFLNTLERHVRGELLQGGAARARALIRLCEIQTVRSYAALPSSSPKLILEHLAAVL